MTPGTKGSYVLWLFCGKAWPGLIEEAERGVKAVMPKSAVFRATRGAGCVAVKSCAKHWSCLFPQHGPGMKHTRSIVLERWQQEFVDEYPGPFLRGLFHSDGCRVTNRVTRRFAGRARTYEYPRYFFSNESADILRLCGEALGKLDIAWRYSRPNVISVARRDAVAALDEYVGPKY